MNGHQPGSLSVADLAVAMADALETPRHVQKRFTVANGTVLGSELLLI